MNTVHSEVGTRSAARITALAVTCLAIPAGPAAAQFSQAPAVIVTVAQVAAVADHIDALGTARATESVNVTTAVAEKVIELGFDDGQQVARGDTLVVLDSSVEQAELTRARAVLAERRLSLERTGKLAAQNLAATEDLDQARLAVQQAEATVAAIEARIDKHVIRAPFDGVVGMRPVSVGAFVSPGDLITTLDDTSTIKLDFSLPAVHLAALSPGQAITATSSAAPTRTYAGRISNVNARVDPATRSVLVRALIDNPDGALRPGMLMRVSMSGNPRQSVVIPESALSSRGGDKSVYVIDEDGLAELRSVRIGTRTPGRVEIVSGLAGGERVVSDGLQKVRPGQSVAVRAVDNGTRSLGDLLSSTAAP